MILKACIQGFGKIEKAEISVGDLVIFVGENNTGKSLVMQLIYVLREEIKRATMTDDNKIVLPITGISNVEGNYLIGKEWVEKWCSTVNDYLEEYKESIIEHYFLQNIPIKVLRVSVEMDVKERIRCEKIGNNMYRIIREYEERGELRSEVTSSSFYCIDTENEAQTKQTLALAAELAILSCDRYSMGTDNIYLPASRTGLQLLYKYFFSERDQMSIDEMHLFGNKLGSRRLGLTIPVYEYLQFLLRYSKPINDSEDDNQLVEFINSKLINGITDRMFDEDIYIPNGEGVKVPLYLSSSLVNEIAPLIKVLHGRTKSTYVFYDEIETCLHPSKQREMARVIIRMVNSGWKLMVSTHSDTMASEFNNLLLLSMINESVEKKKKKMDALSLGDEDLMKSHQVYVYQFKKMNGQNSVAEQLEYIKSLPIGYQFQQFSDNIERLFQETEVITG